MYFVYKTTGKTYKATMHKDTILDTESPFKY